MSIKTTQNQHGKLTLAIITQASGNIQRILHKLLPTNLLFNKMNAAKQMTKKGQQ